jgi:hypothetical protein
MLRFRWMAMMDAWRTSTLLRLVLLIFIVLLVIGSLPAWPYSMHWGYYPSGGLGLLLFVLLILAVMDRL